MSLKHIVTNKEKLFFIDESMNAQEAIDFLEMHHLRCAPVLDESTNLYRGNIYRFHIYEFYFHNPKKSLEAIPVTRFLKNSTRIVRVSDSIIELMFAINDLPYIAVLDESNAFIGIINHSDMLEAHSKSLGLDDAGYLVHFITKNNHRTIQRLLRYINKHTKPHSVIMNHINEKIHIQLLFPHNLNPIELNILTRNLQKRVEDLTFYDMT